jgi:putative nucleotidyltransferase with HDIG domain
MGIKYSSRFGASASSSSGNATCRATGSGLPLPAVRLLELIDQLEPDLNEVVRRALFEKPGTFEKFAAAPASVNGHHRTRGGNLVHTIEVAECALLLARYFQGVVDKQVVLASALLHDLGKCEEYELTPRGTFTSEAGKMVGHKAMGWAMAWAALEPMWKKRSKTALAVMNTLASTSGRSFDLRGPATLEAEIVSKADQLSAAADIYRESLRNSGNSYYGVKHPHMKEHPRHPVALLPEMRKVTPITQSPRLSRSQRFGGF